MRFLRARSIRWQVALSTVLLLLPVAVGAGWSSVRTREERADEVRDEARSIAAGSAAYVDVYLSGLDSVASVLARHPAVVAADREECNRILADVLHGQPLVLDVVQRSRDSALLCSGLGLRNSTQAMAAPYVNDVIASGKPVVSGLVIGEATQQPTVVLAYPVRDSHGAIVGVLDFGLNLLQLQTLFATAPLPEGSVLALTDRLGLVLARSREAERYLGTTMALPSAPPGSGAWASVKADVDGIDRMFGSATLRRGPWTMNVGIPTSVIAARLWPLWRRNLAIVFIVMLSSLLMSLWMGRHLSSQLGQLRVATEGIAEGDLSTMVSGAPFNKELAMLHSAFATMARNLRQAKDDLDRQIEQERKTRETLETLQRQVVRQERLAAVGLLVSGVAHELNNPLQAIMGASELLEHRLELSGEAAKEVALIKTQGHRASEIIRNLSRFSAQRTAEPELVDLRDVVTEVVQLRRTDLDSAQICCDVEIGSNGKMQANFTEIEQVVLNFLINAQQAIESSGRTDGRIVIRTLDVGSAVRLEMSDNGPGVPAGDEAKLFQPFFTTKPVGVGTGLGLSVSYGIIDSYGGKIGYQRNEQGGATFFFQLPKA